MRSRTYDPGTAGSQRRNRAWDAFVAYVMSRRLEHWVMFFAGAVVGAVLG